MAYQTPKEELKIAKQRLKEAEATLNVTLQQREVYTKSLEEWSQFTTEVATRGGATQSNWDNLFSQHTWLIQMDSMLINLENTCRNNIERAQRWVTQVQQCIQQATRS